MESVSFDQEVTSSDGRVLSLDANQIDETQLEAVTKALSSDTRLAILNLLGKQTCSVLYIAQVLNLPQSTATLHVNILERAGLIKTDLQPAKRGLQKMCARAYDHVVIHLPAEKDINEITASVSMPIGAYVDARVNPTCGLAGEAGVIGRLDEPISFYEPDHIQAQLIWFRSGYVEYRFPSRLPNNGSFQALELSFEVCSEAPLHQVHWPSDITVWINGAEVGTWTSPADFGGERGALTPNWWDVNNTQFGLLKSWRITEEGSFLDGELVSTTSLPDLNLETNELISVRVGVKENARNVGGVNLFGSQFGNYPQDLLLKQSFHRNGAPTFQV